MSIFLLILSISSIFLSCFKTFGIVISCFSLISALILLKINFNVDYKKKNIILGIILSTIALINSFIFSFYSNTLKIFFNTTGKDTVTIAKNSKLMQDYHSIQSAITFYKGKYSNIQKLITLGNPKILKSKKDLETIPFQIKDIVAINDSKKKYYTIDFKALDMPLVILNKDVWVIDKEGNVYINLDDFSIYS